MYFYEFYDLDDKMTNYDLDNINETDDVLFAGLTADEISEIEASFLDVIIWVKSYYLTYLMMS